MATERAVPAVGSLKCQKLIKIERALRAGWEYDTCQRELIYSSPGREATPSPPSDDQYRLVWFGLTAFSQKHYSYRVIQRRPQYVAILGIS